MAHDVFISYSKADRAVADALCAYLEARKIRCWYAPRDPEVGSPWPAQIAQAINDCRAMALVFSEAANGSEYVGIEVNNAFAAGKPVFPLRIEPVQPKGTLGFFLPRTHWLDAFTEPMEAHFARMADTLRLALQASRDHDPSTVAPEPGDRQTPEVAPPPPRPPTPDIPTAPRPRRSSKFLEWRPWDLVGPLLARYPGCLLASGLLVWLITWICHISRFNNPVRSLGFMSEDRLLIRSWNGSLKIVEAQTGATIQEVGVLGEDEKRIVVTSVSPDGRLIATIEPDHRVHLWDAETRIDVRELEHHDAEILETVFSDDGRWIAVRSADHTIKVTDVRTGKGFEAIQALTALTSVALSNGGVWVAAGTKDGAVDVWDPSSGRRVAELKSQKGSQKEPVDCVAFAPRGDFLAGGFRGGSIQVWNWREKTLRQEMIGHKGSVLSIALGDYGNSIVSGSLDHTARLWNASDGALLKTIVESGSDPEAGYPTSVAFSPSGGRFAIGWDDGVLQVWERREGEFVKLF